MEQVRARVFCLPNQKANSKRAFMVGGQPRIVQTSKAMKRERDLVKELAPFAPEAALRGPLDLCLDVYHPIPASWPEWRREAAHSGLVLPCTKGTHDLDNVVKLVSDAMAKAGWLEDDTQIVSHRLRAHYHSEPGYHVQLRTVFGRFSPKDSRAIVGTPPKQRAEYFHPLTG